MLHKILFGLLECQLSVLFTVELVYLNQNCINIKVGVQHVRFPIISICLEVYAFGFTRQTSFFLCFVLAVI